MLNTLISKKNSNSKKIIVSRWRPKEFLTGRGHRRVRFFSARSGLATQGSNFYARKSRPRQRVRNLTRKISNPFNFYRQRRPTRRNARTCCFSFREGREKNPTKLYPTRPSHHQRWAGGFNRFAHSAGPELLDCGWLGWVGSCFAVLLGCFLA